jgi:hypothetical protein
MIGLHHQILLLIALDMEVGDFQVAIDIRRELRIHRKYLQCITDRYWIEHGLKVVITIGAFLYDI